MRNKIWESELSKPRYPGDVSKLHYRVECPKCKAWFWILANDAIRLKNHYAICDECGNREQEKEQEKLKQF